MKHGQELLRWTRGLASGWWERRHDPKREPLEVVIAGAYMQGAIDSLSDEVIRQAQPSQEVCAYGCPGLCCEVCLSAQTCTKKLRV